MGRNAAARCRARAVILAVVRATNALTDVDVFRMGHAVTRQLEEHYAPFWEAQATPIIYCAKAESVPKGASVVALLDNADVADALGYHDVTPAGHSYGKVFVMDILEHGGSLFDGPNSVSVTLSHEVLEVVADPYVNWWADGPAEMQHAMEVCDPVEGDAYDIEGVSVSNFVGPRWFRKGDGPYDWLQKLQAPFSISPGGYWIVRGRDGVISQTFGAEFPIWKADGKRHLASRTHKRVTL
jgi:hypothetical protein